eukprot:TRINITY_DN2085_c0_g1_i1.p1 TRINITY_DN2085_c0_g1~~TRINITY_DN2085_c0_g1_i1.p1  ORF type:complete len:1129 (+),score=160.36 TRINITY_DN2085_c0_g1_i1:10219-13605(+)
MAPRRKRFCINQGVVDALQTELDNATGDWIQRALQKAIKNVRLCRRPLLTRRDALEIEGIGDYIASIIETYLNENPPFPDGVPEHILEAQRETQPSASSRGGRGMGRGRGYGRQGVTAELQARNPPHMDLEQDSRSVHKSPSESTPTQLQAGSTEGTPRKRPRTEYIPRIGTATAALLIALLKALEDEGRNELGKEDLATRAEQYTEEKIIGVRTGDPRTWYDGWSCMNPQLIAKGLVTKRGKPMVFKLTENGVSIARTCLKHYEDVQRRRQLRYDDEELRKSCIKPLNEPHSSGIREDDEEITIVPVSSSSPKLHRNGKHSRSKLIEHLRSGRQEDGYQLALQLQAEFDKESIHSQAGQHTRSSAVAKDFQEPDIPSQYVTSVRPEVAGSRTDADNERGTRLARKYATGVEFGTISIAWGRNSVRKNHAPETRTNQASETRSLKGDDNHHEDNPSHNQLTNVSSPVACRNKTTRRRRLSGAPLQRACRVIEKLESEGDSRQDLIMIVGEMFDQGKLPKTEEALMKSLRETMRAVHEAENEECKSPKPMDLVLTTLDGTSGDHKDNNDSSDDEVNRIRKTFERSAQPPNAPNKLDPSKSVPSNEDGIIDLIDSDDVSRSDDIDDIQFVDGEDEEIKLTSNKPRAHESYVISDLNHLSALEERTGVINLVDEEQSPTFVPGSISHWSSNHQHSPDGNEIIVIDGNCTSSDTKQEQIDFTSRQRTIAAGDDGSSRTISRNKRIFSGNEESICIESDNDEGGFGNTMLDRGFSGLSNKQPVPPSTKEPCSPERTMRSACDRHKSHSMPSEINGPQTPHLLEQDEEKICVNNQQTSAPKEVIDLESFDLQRSHDSLVASAPSSTIPECNVILVVDSMERLERRESRTASKFPELLRKNNVMCDVRPLPCGDALFLAQLNDGAEVVLDYVIERKTISDYGLSMCDGRIARQSYLLLNSKISNRLLVLEGDMQANSEVYSQPRMHSKLAELEVCADVYVKRTSNIKDTAHFYGSILRILQRKYRTMSVSKIMEGRLEFSKWSERIDRIKRKITLEDLFMLQLLSLEGLGIEKARSISNQGYKTPQSLHQAYEKEESMREKEVLLNPRGSGVGRKVSSAVAHLFCSEDYNTCSTS